jgi:putative transposase
LFAALPQPQPTIKKYMRIARVVVPGRPHHLTHRGIRRSDVFWDDADRLIYLDLFRSACQEFLLRILAFCLMTNHVHYIAVPETLDSVARVFHSAHGQYDKYFNKKYGLTGNLWEGRPHSSVLDDRHTFEAVRYVEMNPVRARMVTNAVDYKWSSARIRCGVAYDTMLDMSWPPPGAISDWRTWLTEPEDPEVAKLIRRSTSQGRPCGDDSFVRSIEDLTRRRLSPQKRGRKRKNATAS